MGRRPFFEGSKQMTEYWQDPPSKDEIETAALEAKAAAAGTLAGLRYLLDSYAQFEDKSSVAFARETIADVVEDISATLSHFARRLPSGDCQ
jgi:hypothetical protein